MSVTGQCSYVSKERKEPYRYETIIDIFPQKTKLRPDQEMFISRGINGSRKSITSRELESKMKKVAQYLILKGIQKGDHVALYGQNSMERIVAEMGIIFAGGIVVQVTITKEDGSDMIEVMGATNCRGLILDQGDDGLFEKPCHFVLMSYSKEDTCRFILSFREMRGPYKHEYLADVMETPMETVKFPCLYPEDVMTIYTTSGSTGKPKLVEHTHFDLVCSLPSLTWNPNQFTFFDRPFAWSAGSIIRAICGTEVRVFMDPPVPVSDNKISEIWSIIKEEKCQTVWLLPFMLDDLVAMKESYQDSFKVQTIVTLGQTIIPSYADIIGTLCDSMVIIYGSTEFSAASSNGPILPGAIIESGDVGEAHPGVEIKITDEDGNVTKRGVSGDICVRGHAVCNNSSVLSEVFLPNGWITLGDVGRISPSGRLIIEGRTKDIISRGTRKILPASIEDTIHQMKYIKEVVVIGVPDKRLLEEVCVCFVSQSDQNISADDVRAFCEKNLTREKSLDGIGLRPKYYLRFDFIPRLPTGKPDKVLIKKHAEELLI